MLVYITGSYLLVWILQATGLCPQDWFGPDCNLRCYCSSGSTCNENGECSPGGRCGDNHFGPGCQYEDMISWEHTDDYEYIWDYDDSTCNTDDNASVVEVILKKAILFTWYRIKVNDPDTLINFTTTFNTDETCWNERKFVLDTTTVDVTCDTEVTLKTLRITGVIAPSICSVYISAGRNVGLKQKTWQSSNYQEYDLERCGSQNAVDNDRRQNYQDGGCSQTQQEDDGPEWSVTFAEPTRLHFINVRNRDVFQDRLKGSTISLFDHEIQLVKSYILNTTENMYSIHIDTKTAISYVVIKQSTDIPRLDRILTLCEVDAFGDPECPDDTFGTLCDGKCDCDPHEACSFVTGSCAPGCHDGLYGFNCSQRCSAYCAGGICNPFSGHCSPCTDGYSGVMCDLMCADGMFGDYMICTNCSIGCAQACDKSNGHCSCKEGFQGQRCEECQPGSYGPELFCPSCHKGCASPCDKTTGQCTCRDGFVGLLCTDCPEDVVRVDCNFNCSIGCDHRCNIKNGLCSCDESFKGPLCTECETSHYGRRCDLKCPENCLNEICHRSNGTCVACKHGYGGPDCIKTEEMVPLQLITAAIVGTILASSVFYLCACKICQKKKHIEVIMEQTE